MPDPRDPRGVRHALVVMLARTACAVLTGATSLPAEATVRRLLGRIDGDALNRAVGRCRPTGTLGPTAACTQWRSTVRPCAERPGPRAARFIYSPHQRRHAHPARVHQLPARPRRAVHRDREREPEETPQTAQSPSRLLVIVERPGAR
ncbi:transposase family protein [Streptomyces mirabilis]|uniref:transposase family protein n=1 Tax=Streptomyces mirabilis TaxID=68239 RepID=UPI0033AF9074